MLLCLRRFPASASRLGAQQRLGRETIPARRRRVRAQSTSCERNRSERGRKSEREHRVSGRQLGILAVAAAAVLGLTVLGGLAWRAITVQQMDGTGAQRNFEDVLASVKSPSPLVHREAGRFVRRPSSPPVGPPPRDLHVLAYYADGQRLVRGDVPLWFFAVKGPAVTYALRGTGFDLETLGLTPNDLQQAGAGIILDDTRPTGDRLLAWTE